MNKTREKLELHCDVISGYAFKSTDWREQGIPVIKIGNISNGSDVIYDEQTQHVDNDFYTSLDEKYHIEKGDVLISLTGSHINQPNSMVGRCCRNYSGNKFLLNQRAGKVIPLDNTDGGYLYYLLSTNAVKYDIANRAYGVANQLNVSPKDIKSIKWCFPDIQKQRRIADVLSAYDDLIENNNKRIALLEKAAQELYKEWFVRFRFPGHENTKFVNGLPEGWEIKPLGEITDIGSSKRVYLSDYIANGVPFYRSKEIIQLSEGQDISEPLYISDEVYKNFQKKFGAPRKYDILITSVGTIGRSYLSDGHAFYFKDGNLTWLKTCNSPELATMIYCWLNCEQGKQTLSLLTIGTSQSALTIENLRKIKIVIPVPQILNFFAEKVMNINNQKDYLKKQKQNLIKQRDLLLPRLMSGKLEV